MNYFLFLLLLVVTGCGSSEPSDGVVADLSLPTTTTVRANLVPRNGRIAYTAPDTQGQQQVFTVDSEGQNPIQLTQQGQNLYPSWTRDGRRILFSSNRGGLFDLYTMLADRSEQTLVHQSPHDSFLGQYSPDESLVAYIGVVDGMPEIMLYDLVDQTTRQLTTTPFHPTPINGSFLPRFLPDGQHLLHSSSRDGSMQLYSMDLQGKQRRKLTDSNGTDYPHSNAPALNYDGSKLAFWSGFEGNHGEIWTADLEAANPIRLTDQPDTINSDNPAWSPDGEKILFDTNRDGRVGIWVMNADGSDQRLLIDVTQSSQFSWQPLFD